MSYWFSSIPIVAGNMPDKCVWREAENGGYTVKTAYQVALSMSRMHIDSLACRSLLLNQHHCWFLILWSLQLAFFFSFGINAIFLTPVIWNGISCLLLYFRNWKTQRNVSRIRSLKKLRLTKKTRINWILSVNILYSV